MANEDLEKTIKSLQKEIEGCKHEIERLHAVTEIQNLMSEYEYLHTANRHRDVMELYAKDPDTTIYMGELGYWKGADAPQRAWSLLERFGGGKPPVGVMAIHPLVTPFIVVAGDGKTAKGVWLNNGFVAAPDRQTGEQRAMWEWGIYGVDFIKEDGKWKFWHFHMYRLFRTGWDKGLKDWDPDEEVMKVPDDIKPDGPGVDDYPYRPDEVLVLKPDLPKPYQTWADTFSY